MHCYNLGFGKDMVASGIILLVQLNIFVGGSIATKLNNAFDELLAYCGSCNKTTSLKHFDMKTFKITSFLG